MTISIHALTKSATLADSLGTKDYLISIHALTKSATLFFWIPLSFSLNFNPRTHKECDIDDEALIPKDFKFQSTHSQRVRPQYLDHDFNSFLNIGLQINLP